MANHEQSKKRREKHVHGAVRRAAPGSRPGSIQVPDGALPPRIRLTGYGPEKIEVHDNCDLNKVKEHQGKHPVTWIDVAGLGDAKLIEDFGKLFGIHRLALEDVVNIPQRSKVEHFQDYLFVVTQLPHRLEGKQPRGDGSQGVEQVSFFIGKDFILSLREQRGTCFDGVRDRLQADGSVIRNSGSDYLLYTLLDAIIDSYFPTLELVGDTLDHLDEKLEYGSAANLVSRIHGVRHDVRLLRRVIWPLREAIDSLRHEHDWLVGKETQVYLRDCHDHVAQIIETLESYREACSDLRDYHATEISNRMNEIMKVLTIIATIFIPLSFIAGVYGMNFDPDVSSTNMPELRWQGGYFFALGLMATVAVGQLLFFRWRGWLGSSARQRRERAKRGSQQRP